jgi:hypothetical protein
MTVPSLDHYIGREVEDVNKRSGVWQIVLQGSVRIVNQDENWEMPDKDVLVGKQLQRVTMDKGETVLYLGTSDVPNATVIYLTGTNYGLADPDKFEGIVNPNDPDLQRDLTVPPEPTERLQEVEPDQGVAESQEPAGEDGED